jgi:hypothetical protein
VAARPRNELRNTGGRRRPAGRHPINLALKKFNCSAKIRLQAIAAKCL